ncbi:hypothetical protein BC939DRAFT_35229 [Gamsiella multidivaricata]|uniref:uncharacterized protein n=1 Tax=Gamsiella multidivaricata TaxID=101098 RepID=UPI00221F5AC5|nr:uncharacterized protein BC939DRAFT_35229 [Gamsiella multidivaricata]KAI7816627.1 hypothetical protein BC939DRAFT_35229 [Gamsiella multidivaricata]
MLRSSSRDQTHALFPFQIIYSLPHPLTLPLHFITVQNHHPLTMTLKKRQRSVDPNNSINSRQAKRQKKECSIKDNNTTISIAAEQTWRSILEMRKKPTLEQRDNSFKRFLNKTYGCVPNLPQILENHLRPAYIDNDIPNMYPYIKKIINLTQLCISKYGFKHQCTDHSTYSPNKFLENKTAHLRDYAKSLLLSHISGGQPVQLDNEEEGFNKLLSVMELLKEGRIQTAIADITPYWTTADCDTILQHGIATHVKQRELPKRDFKH